MLPCGGTSALLPAPGARRTEGAGRGGPLRAESLAVLAGPDGTAVRLMVESKTSEAPVGVPTLAGFMGVAPGFVSKVLPALAREGGLVRDERGVVTSMRRRALVRRWVHNYTVHGTNQTPLSCIALRGLDRSLTRLEDLAPPATLTGSRWPAVTCPAERCPSCRCASLMSTAQTLRRLAQLAAKAIKIGEPLERVTVQPSPVREKHALDALRSSRWSRRRRSCRASLRMRPTSMPVPYRRRRSRFNAQNHDGRRSGRATGSRSGSRRQDGCAVVRCAGGGTAGRARIRLGQVRAPREKPGTGER